MKNGITPIVIEVMMFEDRFGNRLTEAEWMRYVANQLGGGATLGRH